MSNFVIFLVKRIAAMIVILLILTAIIFGLQRLSHTNPVHAYLGANASKAAIAKESAILGYNKPVINQYFHYVGGLFHGNLGRSLRTRRSVATDIHTYLPATLELTLAALVLALVLGFALGLAVGQPMARHRRPARADVERGLGPRLPPRAPGGARPER